ncbi:sigma-70 family RNA polymerase sigma factor [Peribacillus muralis]|uniref:sigma-70 family RNA polymerase sigma factor n=1 Tax=Peribacillus muralis TaxID=264697 RepID=UPI003D08F947
MDIKVVGETYMEEFDKFKTKNKAFLENKIVCSFLESKENQDLLKNAVCNPSKENEDELDKAFKRFYFNIRFTSYISTALYFNAINFDKRDRKIRNRHPLTVDCSVGDEDGGTFKDMIVDQESEIKIEDFLRSGNILDYLEDPLLCEAVENLTDKQREILDLAYVKGISDTEIGLLLNKSQQAVSKTHKKAIQNIFCHLKEAVQS